MQSQRRFVGLSSAIALVACAHGVFGQEPVIGPQVRIDPGGGTAASNETTVAVSEADSKVIVGGWNDWRASTGSEIIRSGFSLSFDGGQTWSDFILRPPAGFQTSVEGDPMAAYDDRTGTLWAGAIAFGGTHLYVARLDPGEQTFNTAVVALSGGLDKCWMAAGPRPGQPETTRLYVALNTGVLWSDDMGDTWSNPVSLGGGLGFLPRVGPDGELYVAFWDFGGQRFRVARSLNGGSTFTTHTIANRMDSWGTGTFNSRFPGTFRVPPLVYIDVDQNTGNLYACWMDTTEVIGQNANVDLYFSKSTDQGSTWSTPEIINFDGQTPGDQFFPWLEVDKDGRIHIVFFDTRNVIQNDNVVNGMIDAYYMYSTDGGDTWAEHRLTPNSWNSDNDGLNRSSQFIGDYLALGAAGTHVYPIYLDSSAGDTDVFTNVITFSTPATLSDFSIDFGTLIGGDLTSLLESDNNSLRIQSAPGFSAAEGALTQLRLIAGWAGDDEGCGLRIITDAAINHPGGTAKVFLRNYDTQQFDLVDTRPIGMDLSVELFDVADAGPYIRDSDGRIAAQLRHAVVATFSVMGFRSRFDRAYIGIVE